MTTDETERRIAHLESELARLEKQIEADPWLDSPERALLTYKANEVRQMIESLKHPGRRYTQTAPPAPAKDLAPLLLTPQEQTRLADPATSLFERRLLHRKAEVLQQIGSQEASIVHLRETYAEDFQNVLPGTAPDAPGQAAALAPIIAAQARVDALQQAIVRLDSIIAECPVREEARIAALEPLEAKRQVRDAKLAKALKVIDAFVAAFTELGAANQEYREQYGVTAKAWQQAGGIPELKPQFHLVRWAGGIRRKFWGLAFIRQHDLLKDDQAAIMSRYEPTTVNVGGQNINLFGGE